MDNLPTDHAQLRLERSQIEISAKEAVDQSMQTINTQIIEERKVPAIKYTVSGIVSFDTIQTPFDSPEKNDASRRRLIASMYESLGTEATLDSIVKEMMETTDIESITEELSLILSPVQIRLTFDNRFPTNQTQVLVELVSKFVNSELTDVKQIFSHYFTRRILQSKQVLETGRTTALIHVNSKRHKERRNLYKDLVLTIGFLPLGYDRTIPELN